MINLIQALKGDNMAGLTYEPNRRPRPTAALPGTQEKLDVMARRYLAGEELWHDDDGGEPDDD